MWTWRRYRSAKARLAQPPALAPAPAPTSPPAAEQPSPAAGDGRALGDYLAVLDLPSAVERSLEPQEAAEDDRLAAQVWEHFRQNRPGPTSSPTLSLRIVNLIANPKLDASQLARYISRDPAMAAGVLRVANSASYRGLSETETVRDAITRLGINEVGRVAGTLSARTLFNPKLKAEFAALGPRWNDLYLQSATIATAAGQLAMEIRGARSDRAFLGGLLHDVGRTIGLRSLAAIAAAGQVTTDPADVRVDRIIERLHVALGAEVHMEWKLPAYLGDICARHHDAEIPADAESVDLHVVRLVSALLLYRLHPALHPQAPREFHQSALALGLSPRALRAADTQIRHAGEQTATAFGLIPAGG